jgi:hypothetical protein
MMNVLFQPGILTIYGHDYSIKSIAIADTFAIDLELERQGNLWTTSFNIDSISINGLIFESSVEMLDFLKSE